MPLNGYKIGTIRIIMHMPHSQTLQVRFEVRSKPCVAGHGLNRLQASARVIATGARWTVAPAAPVFVAQKTHIDRLTGGGNDALATPTHIHAQWTHAPAKLAPLRLFEKDLYLFNPHHRHDEAQSFLLV